MGQRGQEGLATTRSEDGITTHDNSVRTAHKEDSGTRQDNIRVTTTKQNSVVTAHDDKSGKTTLNGDGIKTRESQGGKTTQRDESDLPTQNDFG